MITGSHHQQIYWYATGRNRLLGQLPGAYLIAEQRWIPRRVGGAASAGRTALLGDRALEQHLYRLPHDERQARVRHAVRIAADRHAGRRYAGSTEFGIACEACHGPSTGHAAANRSPIRRYVSAPDRPRRSDDRAADAARSAALVAGVRPVPRHLGVLRRRRRAAGQQRRACPIRPGDELTKTRFLAQPTRNVEAPTMQALLGVDPGFVSDSFWPDGMVRVSGREYNGLIESPCFKDARDPKRTLTLLLVSHDAPAGRRSRRAVEEWADDQLAPGMDGNQACLQCHQAIAPRAHGAHEAPAGVGRQLLLQLPHAVHDLRAAEDDPQPPDQQSVGRVDASRPGGRTRAISVISTRRWRGPATTSRSGTVRSGSPRPLTSAISRRRCSGR